MATKQNRDNTETINSENLEVDSDVNEDPNRERLLDDSLQSFLESINKE